MRLMAAAYKRSRVSAPCAVSPRGRPRFRCLTLLVNMFTNISVTVPGSQDPRDAGRHLILYDGVCGLCNRLLQFVIARDTRAVFRLASLQSPLGQRLVERFGGSTADPGTFYLVTNYRTASAHALLRSQGVFFILRELGWPWKAA